MPQSLSAVYIHLLFSTKERRPFLRDAAVRESLHAYLGGISKPLGCPPIIAGGMGMGRALCMGLSHNPFRVGLNLPTGIFPR